MSLATWTPHPGSTLERLLADPRPDPVFIDGLSGDKGHVAARRALGFHDQLTGLANRVQFTTELRDAVGRAARSIDVVARLGGDEFAVLVVAPGQDEIDLEIALAVSVGRSVYPADAPDADGLRRRAGEAMFVDKRGRQTVPGVAGRTA